jgi:hypothetical protein
MVALSDDEQEFTLQFTANVHVAKKSFAHLSLGAPEPIGWQALRIYSVWDQ